MIESSNRIDREMVVGVGGGMAGVGNEECGTAHGAKLDNVMVAGKTGTAQVIKEAQGARSKETALPERYRDHAWFVAFAPADHPQTAIACIIEHAGHGGSAAAPVVKAVLQKFFELNPPQGGLPAKPTTTVSTQVE